MSEFEIKMSFLQCGQCAYGLQEPKQSMKCKSAQKRGRVEVRGWESERECRRAKSNNDDIESQSKVPSLEEILCHNEF